MDKTHIFHTQGQSPTLHLVLILLVFLLSACHNAAIDESITPAPEGAATEPAPVSTTEPTVNTSPSSDLVRSYIEACEKGDMVAALSVFTPEKQSNINTYDNGDACLYIPSETDENGLSRTQSSGTTDTVVWEWKTTSEAINNEATFQDTHRFVFALSYNNEITSWEIESKAPSKTERIWFTTRTVTEQFAADPPLFIADDNLMNGVGYIEISEVSGQKVITKEIVATDHEVISETILAEQVVTVSERMVARYGTQPSDQTNNAVTSAASTYLSSMQTTVNESVFRILSFELSDVAKIRPYPAPPHNKSTWLSQEMHTDHQLYTIPIMLEAHITATITYEKNGNNKTFDGVLVLTQLPQGQWVWDKDTWVQSVAG